MFFFDFRTPCSLVSRDAAPTDRQVAVYVADLLRRGLHIDNADWGTVEEVWPDLELGSTSVVLLSLDQGVWREITRNHRATALRDTGSEEDPNLDVDVLWEVRTGGKEMAFEEAVFNESSNSFAPDDMQVAQHQQASLSFVNAAGRPTGPAPIDGRVRVRVRSLDGVTTARQRLWLVNLNHRKVARFLLHQQRVLMSHVDKLEHF